MILKMGKTEDGEPPRRKQKGMSLKAEQIPIGLTGVTNFGKVKENVANQNTLTKPTPGSCYFYSYEVFPHF